MDLSLEQWLWIGLAVTLGVGYLLGLMRNRRLGQRAYRWLHAGLRAAWDRPVQGRWLGSAATGARLSVARPPAPWRAWEAAFLLQTRELWPLWLVNRLRGKGDELVLRATLRHRVTTEWEMGPRQGRQATAPAPGFVLVTDLPLPPNWVAWARPTPQAAARAAWEPLLTRYADALRGVSLRREAPHLIVRLDLTAAMRAPAQDLIHACEQAATAAVDTEK